MHRFTLSLALALAGSVGMQSALAQEEGEPPYPEEGYDQPPPDQGYDDPEQGYDDPCAAAAGRLDLR